MDDVIRKELEAIEKLLKSYEMLNSSLETRIRVLEFQMRKMKEDLSGLKGENIENNSFEINSSKRR